LLVTSLFALPAHAGTPAAPALQVKIGDLDLTRPEGVEVLYRRLQFAAHQVCGASTVTGTRISSREWQSCVDAAVGNAVQQLNRPALSAFHRSQTRRTETERG